MKQKTIEIPIYCAKLTMILDKDLSFMENKFKTKSLEDYGSAVDKDKEEYRHYYVAFTDSEHLSNICHEIVHIKNLIYSDCAMKLSTKYDEHEAYLVGWLFDEIYNFLKSADKK